MGQWFGEEEVIMVWLNRFISFFFICFSLSILVSSINLGIGSIGAPGSGFVPFLAAVLCCLLSLVVLVQREVRNAKDRKHVVLGELATLKKPVVLVVSLAAYTLLLRPLGYVGTMFLLMFALLTMGYTQKLYLNIFFAAIIASISFFIFHSCLKVELPRGILSFLR